MSSSLKATLAFLFIFAGLTTGCGPKGNERVEAPEKSAEDIRSADERYAEQQQKAREAMN